MKYYKKSAQEDLEILTKSLKYFISKRASPLKACPGNHAKFFILVSLRSGHLPPNYTPTVQITPTGSKLATASVSKPYLTNQSDSGYYSKTDLSMDEVHSGLKVLNRKYDT
jgi:hypothetical protein